MVQGENLFRFSLPLFSKARSGGMVDKVMKNILNKKVLGISDTTIYFEGGVCVDYHPYETYTRKYTPKGVDIKQLQYFSPKLIKLAKK